MIVPLPSHVPRSCGQPLSLLQRSGDRRPPCRRRSLRRRDDRRRQREHGRLAGGDGGDERRADIVGRDVVGRGRGTRDRGTQPLVRVAAQPRVRRCRSGASTARAATVTTCPTVGVPRTGGCATGSSVALCGDDPGKRRVDARRAGRVRCGDRRGQRAADVLRYLGVRRARRTVDRSAVRAGASQRYHWYAYAIVPAPVQVPAETVSCLPCCSWPADRRRHRHRRPGRGVEEQRRGDRSEPEHPLHPLRGDDDPGGRPRRRRRAPHPSWTTKTPGRLRFRPPRQPTRRHPKVLSEPLGGAST